MPEIVPGANQEKIKSSEVPPHPESRETVESVEDAIDRTKNNADRAVEGLRRRGEEIAERVARKADVDIDDELARELEAIDAEARRIRSALDTRLRPSADTDVILEAGDTEEGGVQERSEQAERFDRQIERLQEAAAIMEKTNEPDLSWERSMEMQTAIAAKLEGIALDAALFRHLSERDGKPRARDLYLSLDHYYQENRPLAALPAETLEGIRKELFERRLEELKDPTWQNEAIQILTKLNRFTYGPAAQGTPEYESTFKQYRERREELIANRQQVTEAMKAEGISRDWAQTFSVIAGDHNLYEPYKPLIHETLAELTFPSNNSMDIAELANTVAYRNPELLEQPVERLLQAIEKQQTIRSQDKPLVQRWLKAVQAIRHGGGRELGDELWEKAETVLRKQPDGLPLIATTLLTDFDPKQNQRALDMLQAEGLPVDAKLVETWGRCAGRGEMRSDVMRQNIEAVQTLEEERPGSVAQLRKEFGIENFGRYPADMLIGQYDAKDNVSEPYGIVLYPKSDYNGAFFKPAETGSMANLYRQTKGKYHVRIFEAGSKMDVARALVKTKQRYAQNGAGKIAFALIGGHGEQNRIQFGEGKDRVNLRIDDLAGKGAQRAGGEFFEPDVPIVLQSCSTGKEGGIGQKLSEVLSAHVIAPDTPTNFKHLNVSFTDAGKPEFDVAFHRGDSKSYTAGQSVSA